MRNLNLKNIHYIFLLLFLVSCGESIDIFTTPEGKEIRKKVDQMVVKLDSHISKFDQIVKIDHSRFAEQVEVYTPPSIVSIFSNPEVNSKLIKKDQLIGIDLPYRILCYAEPDLKDATIAYTNPEFIMKRHGLNKDDIKEFTNDIQAIISEFPKESISKTDLNSVDKGFAIIEKKSDFDFNTTMEKIKAAINAQGDTKMFGEIDYKKEALAYNIDIDPTTLILFGAPEPGGKAMHSTPKLGLDAFCQKILIYQKGNSVYVAYNDIIMFSKLYYNKSTVPQRIVNYRIGNVFEEAVSAE